MSYQKFISDCIASIDMSAGHFILIYNRNGEKISFAVKNLGRFFISKKLIEDYMQDDDKQGFTAYMLDKIAERRAKKNE